MKITIINKNFKNNVLNQVGSYAATCYSSKNYDELIKNENNSNIAKFCISSGHHSIFDHAMVTLNIENIPKILAMLLNNIGFYNTTERSARYTDFGDEYELYNKWKQKFYNIIKNSENVKDFIKNEKSLSKLALENARYFLPIEVHTNMIYTISIRQLSYLVNILNNTKYDYEPLNDAIDEFCKQIKKLSLIDLEITHKDGQDVLMKSKLSFSNKRLYATIYNSDIYAFHYECSFACFAQLQRHRSIDFYITKISKDDYYVPEIIKDTSLEDEYILDMKSIHNYIPQGRMIYVNEYGNLDAFKLKCLERLCSRAQLEIMNITKSQQEKINDPSFIKNDKIVPRCGNFKCSEPCKYGISGLNRII